MGISICSDNIYLNISCAAHTGLLWLTSLAYISLVCMQIARDKLVSLGTCVGKFTHSGKFRLTIGCLDLLSQYAKYKVRFKFVSSQTHKHLEWRYFLLRGDVRLRQLFLLWGPEMLK